MRRAWGLAVALSLLVAPLSADTKSACASAFERAQTRRLESKPVEALEAARQCGLPACPAVVRPMCTKWITELEAELASVTISVHDDQGHALPGATATLDGATVATGTPVWLERGKHTVSAEHDGKRATREFEASAGEQGRAVALVLTAPAAPPSPATSTAAPEPVRSPPRTAAFVATGVAVVGLGAFAYFGSQGKSRRDELDRTCAPRCADADVDSVRKKLLFADLGLTVGLVAGAAAAYLFLRPSPRAAVGVGHGGAVVQGSF